MNKVIALLAFSILLLVPVGIHNAFAGISSSCTLPNHIMLTLDQGETSDVITSLADCTSPVTTSLSTLNCAQNPNLSVNIINTQFPLPNQYQYDLTITNDGGIPGQTHCHIDLGIGFLNGDPGINFDQEIWVTTTPKLVGGNLIPIESTSLILANTQSLSWMIPVLVSGIGIGLFVISRKSENS